MFTQKAQFPTMCTAEHLVEFRNCHGGHHSWSPVNIPYPTSVGGSWPHWGLSPSSIWLFPLPWLTFPELYSASWHHFLSKLLVLKIFPPTFLWRELKLRYMQNRCLIENNWEHFCLKKKDHVWFTFRRTEFIGAVSILMNGSEVTKGSI